MSQPARLVAALVLGLLAAPPSVHAQTGRVHRVGFLGVPSARAAAHFVEAFREGLRGLGWEEGKNIAVEYRWAESRYERLPGLAAELVGLKVDVIVAMGTPGPVAAKKATTTIPIVMANAGDPVGTGLVASLARPGGNVTGLSLVNPDLIGKQLQLLHEALPTATRVAVLRSPTNPLHALSVKEAEAAATSLRVQLQFAGARAPADLADAFTAIREKGAGALLVVSDGVFFQERKRIVDLAAKHRLPTMYPWREGVEAGGLIALGAHVPDSFRRAAAYVDKILRGAAPAELPVEQPTRFELVINLKTAKTLGLTIPQSLLLRADQVMR